MDAKQVWRAALGELQVSLSPANFETWLRDTALVEVDDNRFRISVPNGFAKDWLESRYRSLISQTLARIVGYSVQVEFIITLAPDAVAPQTADGEPEGDTPVDGLGLRTIATGPAIGTTGLAGATTAVRPVVSSSQSVRVEPTRVGGEGGTTSINPRYT